MSFITRCPACATAFRVVPDQLKISEGWVRCGHCQQIFDATLDLQPWWPGSEGGAPVPAQVSGVALPTDTARSDAPEPVSPTSDEPPLPDTPAAPASPAAPVVDDDPQPDAAQVSVEAWPDAPALQAEPPSSPISSVGSDAEPQEPYLGPLDESPTPLASPSLGQEPVDASVLASVPDAVTPATQSATYDQAPLSADEPTPSFVRQAQRRAYWRRPGVRALLALCALLLLALAAVQAALHWRDLWAARAPALAEPLGTLCQMADCVVETPRLLQEVVIDSSVLLRKGVGRYLFNAVVRNQSDIEVAAPALELTLTDAQDQVLVRRVLLPQEWPEPVATLPPRSERPLQFELDLPMDESQVMTGYRALLFYP
jgi:predicted Zn finger-like uncharacterized protein